MKAFILLLASTVFPSFAIEVANVRHVTRAKIIESNAVAIRPGSVYDTITVFESHLGIKPKFFYEFVDTGLGTAEPLYPLYQKGTQGNWLQLLRAAGNKEKRHIDHYSALGTPEGCWVDSLYALRHISEFPPERFAEERAQGYEQVVVRFEHYTRMNENAECGRHKSNSPDPNYTPTKLRKLFKRYRNIQSIKELPAEFLERVEARISVNFHIEEQRPCRTCSIDRAGYDKNSLWFYPEGRTEDFGRNENYYFDAIKSSLSAPDLIAYVNENLRSQFSLTKLLNTTEYSQLMQFLNGEPLPNYDALSEPGSDVFKLSDVNDKHFLTSGHQIIKNFNPQNLLSNRNNIKLVAVAFKPFAKPEHSDWNHLKYAPQVRLVFQLYDSENQAFVEQFFLHLAYDVFDRNASEEEQAEQTSEFLAQILALKESGKSDAVLVSVLKDLLDNKPVESLSFSTALTGNWFMGRLTRAGRPNSPLQPFRIVVNGVDHGYYSSIYDNDQLREAIQQSSGERQDELKSVLNSLTVSTYRDLKRFDTEKIHFGRVSCAQCHHMSARDAIHVSLNDHIDSRFSSPLRGSQFFYAESQSQLKEGSYQSKK